MVVSSLSWSAFGNEPAANDSNSSKVDGTGSVNERLSQPSDEVVIARLAAGELSELGVLYVRHGSQVLRFLTHTTGDPSAAEDLCQDVFLAVPNAAKRYRELGKLRPWLLGIAARKAKSWKRRQWVRATLLDRFRFWAPLESECEPPHALPAQQSAIERAFVCLPQQFREVLLLQVAEGLTGLEIAAALGISPGAARVRLHRARQELRKLLGDAAFDVEAVA